MPIPILLLTGLAAVLDPPPIASSQPPFAPRHHANRPFISPMGEPFLVRSQGDDTLVDWFEQADGNHDGSLSAVEMQVDADRFFGLLDTNHDGEIDPDEMTHYEQVIAPDWMGGFRLTNAGGDGPSSDSGRNGRGHGHWGGRSKGGWDDGDGGNGAHGRARYGLLDLPEPVAAADADLSRGISRDEFRQAAQLRFQALDVTRQGRLTLDVLETLRPPPPVRPKKDPDAPSGLDANADTGGG